MVVDRVELENGHETSREVVEHPGGVCVAALTEKNELLFVRQFRYPYGEVVLELPAGKLEKGSTPLENGKTGAERGNRCHRLWLPFSGKIVSLSRLYQ